MAKFMRDVLNQIDDNTTSGELVRSARKRLNLTQEEVCELTGLKRENLSAIENNRIEMTVHYAKIFGAVFGLSPIAILFPNGYKENSKDLLAIQRRRRPS